MSLTKDSFADYDLFDAPWGAEEPRESQAPKPLTVSDAMQRAKTALERVNIRLVGEVSEVSNKPGYRAVYFSVKDEKATLPCMMWMNRFNASGVELRVGQLVELEGRFSLYAAKGRMNFDVSSLRLAGEGDLRAKVAAIAKKLEAEGLTSSERKRPLPLYPATIGLVTSPRGAAVHDVLRTLRRRFPIAQVHLAGVPVEGANAPEGLIRGLQTVAASGVEVILLVRGGGSFEDLMPFNDEKLARAVASCPVPVVTGIGHEPDTCVVDLVSDYRASTPTAAAEAVSPSREQLCQTFVTCHNRLTRSFGGRLEKSRLYLRRYSEHPLMKDPSALYASESQSLDLAALRLDGAIPGILQKDRNHLDLAHQRLSSALPTALLSRRSQISSARQRVLHLGSRMVPAYGAGVSVGAARLQDLSPLTILSRGYAIARDDQGKPIKSTTQVHIGSEITVTVADGDLLCSVDNFLPETESDTE